MNHVHIFVHVKTVQCKRLRSSVKIVFLMHRILEQEKICWLMKERRKPSFRKTAIFFVVKWVQTAVTPPLKTAASAALVYPRKSLHNWSIIGGKSDLMRRWLLTDQVLRKEWCLEQNSYWNPIVRALWWELFSIEGFKIGNRLNSENLKDTERIP